MQVHGEITGRENSAVRIIGFREISYAYADYSRDTQVSYRGKNEPVINDEFGVDPFGFSFLISNIITIFIQYDTQ